MKHSFRFLKLSFALIRVCLYPQFLFANQSECPERAALLNLAEENGLAAILRGKTFFLDEFDKIADQAKNRNPSFLKTVAVQIPKEKWSPTALANLKDGEYVYLIARDGQIMLLPRLVADPRNPTAFLGSHDGLARLLNQSSREKSKSNLEIVAAGELILRGGRAHIFSNKAGTRRASSESLEWAKKVFKANGALLDDSTLLVDFSKKPLFGHSTDYQNAKAEKAILETPGWLPLYDRFAQVCNEAVKRRTEAESLIRFIIKYSKQRPEMRIETFASALETILKTPGDSLTFTFAELMKKPGADLADSQKQLEYLSEAVAEFLRQN